MAPNARRFPRILLAVVIGIGVTIHGTGSAAAVTDIGLAGAESFAVSAGTTVTNAGLTEVLSGHVGGPALGSVTGFGPGVVAVPSIVHEGTADAIAAQAGLTAAITTANQIDEGPPLVGPQLGAKVLTAGVYSFGSLDLTGTLTLDGQGNQDAVFIIRSGSSLTTAATSVVNLIGSAQACKVFWELTSSATLGADSTFVGTILATTSISVDDNATISGRLLAKAAVTLINDTITRPTCLPAVTTTTAGAFLDPSLFAPPPTTTSTSTTSTTSTTVARTTTTTAVVVPTTVAAAPAASVPVVEVRALSPVGPVSGSGSGVPGAGDGGDGDGSGITGDLPRTGGSTQQLLLVSLLGVLVGTVLIVSSSGRRRSA